MPGLRVTLAPADCGDGYAVSDPGGKAGSLTGAEPGWMPLLAVTPAGMAAHWELKLPLLTERFPVPRAVEPLEMTLPLSTLIEAPLWIESELPPPLQLPPESVTSPAPLVPPVLARPWAVAPTLMVGPITKPDMKPSRSLWIEVTSKTPKLPVTLETRCSLSFEPDHVTSMVLAVHPGL